MRRLLLLLLIGFAVSLTSCRNDFDFESRTGGLEFSKDTIYLDTVFTNIGSSTYTLKVYNQSNENISIPSIRLGKGAASKYQLMVDGMPGKEFLNVEMLAKDSMYIFVSVNADVAATNPNDFLYTDQLLFGVGTNFQKVELVTLIQDAYFIFPQRNQLPDETYEYEQLYIGDDANGIPQYIKASFLDENDPDNGNELQWNNSKPYVIYGYAVVPPTKTLTVQAGARVHFHDNSGLIVANNASLHIEGEPSNTNALEKEVIFEGDRLEPDFADVPGQWGTIWLTQGSTNNQISNLTIKNATVGLLVTGNDGTSTPTLDINNAQIYNCSNVGLLARTGNIEGRNVVINNCGQTSLACTIGGSYDFTHCTFANYWSSPSQTCLILDDYYETSTEIITEILEKADFKNCIFYGSSNLSIRLTKKNENDNNYNYNYSFKNCLIKFIDQGNQVTNTELYQFSTNTKYQNCIIATNSTSNRPYFKNPSNNELIIGDNSAARGSALSSFSTFRDILNKERNGLTDIGAYNWITFD